MPTAVIILSTYNGAKYLPAQLDSVLAQHGVEVAIWARDDGSTDGTREILASYARDPRLKWVAGQNIGAADSFMEAVRSCPIDGDYYGFCDQDDVWLEDKLSIAIEELRAIDNVGPSAVCSTVTIVDKNLIPLGRTSVPPRGLSFRNALVETVTCGSTILINQSAFDLLRTALPMRGVIVMHDAWLYLLLSAVGRIIFYDRPGVLYRQHESNVFGAGNSFTARCVWRLKRALRPSRFWNQARDFYYQFSALLKEEDRNAIERYIDYRQRRTLGFLHHLRFALRPSFECQSRKADLYLRILCLFGRG